MGNVFFLMAILMFDFTYAGKLIIFKFIIPIPFFLLQDISTIITILWGNNLTKTSWFRYIDVRNTGYFFRAQVSVCDNIGTSQLLKVACNFIFFYVQFDVSLF